MAVFGYFCYSDAEIDHFAAVPQKQEEAQSRAITEYCRERGLPLESIFHDLGGKWSTEFGRREQSQRLVARLGAGDIVVCNSLERMFGSVTEVCEMLKSFRRKSIRLYVSSLDSEITSDECVLPLDRMLESLVALEKRRSAEGIRNVKIRERKKGRYLGGSRPFGYMIHQNGMLIENPMEQKVLRRILALKEQGWSLRVIARKVTTPATPISFKTVQRVLQRHAEQS